MYILLSIFAVIASLLLMFFVTIQNPKGGGLAAGFSSSNQVMGVRKTTDFLEKATWTLMILIVVFSVGGAAFAPSKSAQTQNSEIKDNVKNAVTVDPNAVSPFQTPVPQSAEKSAQKKQNTAPASEKTSGSASQKQLPTPAAAKK